VRTFFGSVWGTDDGAAASCAAAFGATAVDGRFTELAGEGALRFSLGRVKSFLSTGVSSRVTTRSPWLRSPTRSYVSLPAGVSLLAAGGVTLVGSGLAKIICGSAFDLLPPDMRR
jgi:hypothetical protein